MFVTADNLQNEHSVHGFFGRKGPDYAALGLAPNRLVMVRQVHSADCVQVAGPWAGASPEADAMITDVPGQGLGIITADCAPVLFYGEKADGAPVIGAAHAGWGGALKGVLENTVQVMLDLGADPANLRAALGPCIAQCSYEVSDDFMAPFLAQDAANEQFFAAGAQVGRQQFDLPGYVRRRVELAGVGNVFATGIDTYAQEDDYYSFRRATHRGERDDQRQVSVIFIKER